MSDIFETMTKSVFPVLITETNNTKNPHRYSGAGFFVKVSETLVFVTAGHVGASPDRRDEERIILGERTNVGEYNQVTCSGKFFYNMKEDISILIPDSTTLSRFKSKIIPLSIYQHRLSPLSDVFTFGYPFSSVESSKQTSNKKILWDIHIRPLFLKGYITRTVMRADLLAEVERAFSSNYQVSFPCYNGISGSPLMVQIGPDIFVVGMLYQNSQTSYYTGPIEVEADSEGNILQESYARYDFGLASTEESLLGAISVALDPGWEPET